MSGRPSCETREEDWESDPLKNVSGSGDLSSSPWLPIDDCLRVVVGYWTGLSRTGPDWGTPMRGACNYGVG